MLIVAATIFIVGTVGLLLYSTVIVEEDGQIFFLDDLYGHDARLAAWLEDRYPYRAADR